MKIKQLIKAGTLSLAFLTCQAFALVDPKVDAWQDMVQNAREVSQTPGSEILPEALDELGGLASDLMKAPLKEYMSELEERRGLKFKYFTPWHVKDRTQLRAWFKTQLKKEFTPQKIDETTSLLKVLGLVKTDFELIPFLEDLLTSQVAGVYDPEQDQFFLVDTEAGRTLAEKSKDFAINQILKGSGLSTSDQVAITTVHELDHALGGQYFPLLKKFSGDGLAHLSTDQQMALQALVEGDATFVMIDASNKQAAGLMGAQTYVQGADLMAKMVGIAAVLPLPLPGMAGFAAAPLYFQRSLMFPYFNGAEYVSSLRHQEADWRKVNAAYSSPPSSTHEILHPFSKKTKELKPLNLSSIPKSINAWETIGDDSGGEFLVQVVLEQYGVKDFAEIARSWSADRIRIFSRDKGKKIAFLWAIRWQDVDSATTYASIIRQQLPFSIEQNKDTTTLYAGFSAEESKTLLRYLK